MSASIRAYAFLSITALCWGGNAVAGKLAVGHVSPMLLTTLRWAIALAIILPLALPRLRRDWPKVRAALPLLLAYGALGFTSFNILFYSALQYTSAINVVIEQAGVPVVIFLVNFLLFRIRVGLLQIVGFGLTFIGVALTASNGALDRLAELELNRGDVLMLFAILIYGGYTVSLRFKPDLNWQSMMATMVVAAFLASIPFALYEAASGAIIYPDGRGLAVALYTAVFPALVAQVFYIKGNELIGSNRAGLFVNFVPIFGTLMSILVLGEALQLYHVVALTLVLGGIMLAERGVARMPAA